MSEPDALNRRYPGYRTFGDSAVDRLLYFGREHEAEALLNLVLAEDLVVFFARSGAGKSSLIRAALLEPLRRRGYFHVVTRVNDARGPFAGVWDDLGRQATAAGIEYEPCQTNDPWEYFKRAEFWRDDELLTPFLVLDQFEELFTIVTPARRSEFIRQIGDLVRDGIPRQVRERLQSAGVDPRSRYSSVQPRVKLLISMREDYLGHLEELAVDVPQIYESRYRLKPLTPEQARECIVRPAQVDDGRLQTPPFGFDDGAVDEMIRYLSQTQNEANSSGPEWIEPFHVQLLCESLEEKVKRRVAAGRDAAIVVDADDLGGTRGMDAVLGRFVERTLEDAAPDRRTHRRVLRLCSRRLISPDGHRLSLEQRQISRNFRVDEPTLARLTDRRLLVAEPRVGSTYYELSHDTLVHPVLQAQRKLEKKHRSAWVTAGVVVVALALAGWAAERRRDSARDEASRLANRAAHQNDPIGAHEGALEAVAVLAAAGLDPPASVENAVVALMAQEFGSMVLVDEPEAGDGTAAVLAAAAGAPVAAAWTPGDGALRVWADLTSSRAVLLEIAEGEVADKGKSAGGEESADPSGEKAAGGDSEVVGLALDPSGVRLAAALSDGRIVGWRRETSGEAWTRQDLDWRFDQGGALPAPRLAWNEPATRLLVASGSNVWHYTVGQEANHPPRSWMLVADVEDVGFGPDGQALAWLNDGRLQNLDDDGVLWSPHAVSVGLVCSDSSGRCAWASADGALWALDPEPASDPYAMDVEPEDWLDLAWIGDDLVGATAEGWVVISGTAKRDVQPDIAPSGRWVERFVPDGWSVEPEVFTHYFLLTDSAEAEEWRLGESVCSVYRGRFWDGTDAPSWVGIDETGAETGETWWIAASALSYLGPVWRPEWSDLEGACGVPQPNPSTPLARLGAIRVAGSSTSWIGGDTNGRLWTQAASADPETGSAGAWVDRFSVDVTAEKPPQIFDHYFRFEGDAGESYTDTNGVSVTPTVPRGTVVRGREWDATDAPRWQVVDDDGQPTEEDEWLPVQTLVYLGPTLRRGTYVPPTTTAAHDGRVSAVAARARIVASAGEDGRVVTWSRDGNELDRIASWSTPAVVTALVVTDSSVHAAGRDGVVRTWSIEGASSSAESLECLDAAPLAALAVHARLGTIVAGDGVACWWDGEGNRIEQRFDTGSLAGVAFVNERALVQDRWGRICEWSRDNGCRRQLALPAVPTQVTFGQDGMSVVGVSGRVAVRELDDDGTSIEGRRFGSVTGQLLAVSHDGPAPVVAASTPDGLRVHWPDGQRERQVRLWQASTSRASFAGSGRMLLAAAVTGEVRVFFPYYGATLTGEKDTRVDASAMAVSRTGDHVALGFLDGSVRLLRPQTGAQFDLGAPVGSRPITGLSYVAGGTILAVAADGASVSLIDLKGDTAAIPLETSASDPSELAGDWIGEFDVNFDDEEPDVFDDYFAIVVGTGAGRIVTGTEWDNTDIPGWTDVDEDGARVSDDYDWVSADRVAHLGEEWNPQWIAEFAPLETPRALSGWSESLLASSDRGSVDLWSTYAPTLESVASFFVPRGAMSLGFGADGETLLVGSSTDDTGRVTLYSLSGAELGSSLALRATPTVTRVSASGTAAAGLEDGAVMVWPGDLRGRQAFRRNAHGGAARALAFHTESELLASGGDDATIRLWRVPPAQNLWSAWLETDDMELSEFGESLNADLGEVRDLAFLDEGVLVARMTNGVASWRLGWSDWTRSLCHRLRRVGAMGRDSIDDSPRRRIESVCGASTDVPAGPIAVVSSRADGIDAPMTAGDSTLSAAAHAGRAAIVDQLLDGGASVDAADDVGITPLMRAARAGHADIVMRLLMAGADPDLETIDGVTALEMADDGVKPLLRRMSNGTWESTRSPYWRIPDSLVPSDLDPDVREAVTLEDQGQLDSAGRAYLELARSGVPHAAFRLERLHYYFGVPAVDASEVLTLLESAAQAGDPWATVNLSARHQDGLYDLSRDGDRARDLLQPIAAEGFARAQAKLGALLLSAGPRGSIEMDDWSVEPDEFRDYYMLTDPEVAEAWDLSDSMCTVFRGSEWDGTDAPGWEPIDGTGSAAGPFVWIGARGLSHLGSEWNPSWDQWERDYAVSGVCGPALALLEAAAGQGDPSASFTLGEFYASTSTRPGTATTDQRAADEAEALRHFEAAAAGGYTRAHSYVGRFLEHGRGGRPANLEAAVEAYRLGATGRDPEALFRLGWMLEHGRGANRDALEAVRLYRRAATMGSTKAMTRLDWLGVTP